MGKEAWVAPSLVGPGSPHLLHLLLPGLFSTHTEDASKSPTVLVSLLPETFRAPPMSSHETPLVSLCSL